jgi:hypothetical protein
MKLADASAPGRADAYPIELKGPNFTAAIFRFPQTDLVFAYNEALISSCTTEIRILVRSSILSTTTTPQSVSTAATMGMLPILPSYASGDLGLCDSSFCVKRPKCNEHA